MKITSHCCQACGYNLTGNTSGVCPECGAGFDPADPSTYLMSSRRKTSLGTQTEIVPAGLLLVVCAISWPSGRRTLLLPVWAFLPAILMLAFGVGLAISAARRARRLGRLAALATLLAGLWLLWGSLYHVHPLAGQCTCRHLGRSIAAQAPDLPGRHLGDSQPIATGRSARRAARLATGFMVIT